MQECSEKDEIEYEMQQMNKPQCSMARKLGTNKSTDNSQLKSTSAGNFFAVTNAETCISDSMFINGQTNTRVSENPKHIDQYLHIDMNHKSSGSASPISGDEDGGRPLLSNELAVLSVSKRLSRIGSGNLMKVNSDCLERLEEKEENYAKFKLMSNAGNDITISGAPKVDMFVNGYALNTEDQSLCHQPQDFLESCVVHQLKIVATAIIDDNPSIHKGAMPTLVAFPESNHDNHRQNTVPNKSRCDQEYCDKLSQEFIIPNPISNAAEKDDMSRTIVSSNDGSVRKNPALLKHIADSNTQIDKRESYVKINVDKITRNSNVVTAILERENNIVITNQNSLSDAEKAYKFY